MSDSGKRDIVSIEYVRENYTRDTIRSVNEQCQEIWYRVGFVDDELIAERDEHNPLKWNVQPRGVV